MNTQKQEHLTEEELKVAHLKPVIGVEMAAKIDVLYGNDPFNYA